MAYYCPDCSYSGATAGLRGECPACGSLAMVKRKNTEEKAKPSKWRLVLLAALWAYLIGHVSYKLVS